MQEEKPNTQAYFIAIFSMIAFSCWAIYDYNNDTEKIPFEPIIAFFLSLFTFLGYLWYKNNKSKEETSETPTSIGHTINNQNAKIGQQNIGSSVNNTNSKFEL